MVDKAGAGVKIRPAPALGQQKNSRMQAEMGRIPMEVGNDLVNSKKTAKNAVIRHIYFRSSHRRNGKHTLLQEKKN